MLEGTRDLFYKSHWSHLWGLHPHDWITFHRATCHPLGGLGFQRMNFGEMCCAQLPSHVRLFATIWTVACQASQSLRLSQQEYWSGQLKQIKKKRILEWVAISYSRRSSTPRNQTRVSCGSCTGWWFLYHWGTLGRYNHAYFPWSWKLPTNLWLQLSPNWIKRAHVSKLDTLLIFQLYWCIISWQKHIHN